MNLEPQWIAGFVDGEGCFHVRISRNQECSTGYQVLPEFVVTQHERNIQVLYALQTYFGTGVVRSSKSSSNPIKCYRVRDTKALREIIVPFFFKHELKTAKKRDFLKFRDVLLIMERREHLSEEGLEKIRSIKIESNFEGNL